MHALLVWSTQDLKQLKNRPKWFPTKLRTDQVAVVKVEEVPIDQMARGRGNENEEKGGIGAIINQHAPTMIFIF